MECSACKLTNPEGAQRCDCGYDFASRSLKESYVAPTERSGNRWTMSSRGVMFGSGDGIDNRLLGESRVAICQNVIGSSRVQRVARILYLKIPT